MCVCCVLCVSSSSTLRSNNIDYMELRLWIGLHSCLQCLILVATDASYIIKYITRCTEEGFSSLISFIFISDAIKKMVCSTHTHTRTHTRSHASLRAQETIWLISNTFFLLDRGVSL